MNSAFLFIGDGQTEVNLLDRHSVHVDGWVPKAPELKGGGVYAGSALAEGRQLASGVLDNVVEEIPLYVMGGDADQVAEIQHKLAELTRRLRQYFTNAARYSRPVYLGWAEFAQSNLQYAALKNYTIQANREAFAHEMKGRVSFPAVWVATLFLEREPGWRSHAPATLPTSPLSLRQLEAPASLTENYIVNARDNRDGGGITHIYRFDSSAGTFSANLIASTAFEYFPNPVGTGDILYIGQSSPNVYPFRNIVFHIGTALVGTASIVQEFWDGGAWVALADGTTETDTTNDFRETGQLYVKIIRPTDWAANTINGVNAFWIRFRYTTGTMTTIPAQNTRVVYAAMEPKITLASTNLDGDLPALLRMHFNNKSISGADTLGIMQIVCGAKSRGLTNFRSHLNAGNMPSGWTISVGTDTAGVTDPFSPTNQRKTVTFATDQTLVARLTWENTNDAVASDFTGIYRAFLRCNQITGSAGAVTVQLQIAMNNLPLNTEGVTFRSAQKALRRVFVSGEKAEVVDFGIVNIPLLTNARALASPAGQLVQSSQINIAIYASATSATPDLYLYDLILIPVDEMYFSAEVPDLDGSVFQSIQANNELIVDAGLLGMGAHLNNNWESAADQPLTSMQWYPTTPLPRLEPDQETALYFFFTDGGDPVLSTVGQGCMLEIYAHERWTHFRGDE